MDIQIEEIIKDAGKTLIAGLVSGVAAGKYLEEGVEYLNGFIIPALLVIVFFYIFMEIIMDRIKTDSSGELEGVTPTPESNESNPRLNTARSSSPSFRYERR